MLNSKGYFIIYNMGNIKRIPKNYNGKLPTGRSIQNLLPKILNQIEKVHIERPDLIMAFWPSLVGDRIALMTKAISFKKGILLVTVHNSSLLNLLVQCEKNRLLHTLKKRFPSVTIHDIMFRIG